MSKEKQIIHILVHEYEFGKNYEYNETKVMGAYSNKQNAEEAIDRYVFLSGFNRYPRSCFTISEYELDKDQLWTEGFISSDEIVDDFKKITLCINEWMSIHKSAEESWKDKDYYNAVCEIEKKVFKVSSPEELANHISRIWKIRFPNIMKSYEEYHEIAKKLFEISKS